MAAKNQILFHLFLTTVLVNAFLETIVANEHHPDHDADPKHHHSDAANETDDHERKFRWPSPVPIFFNRAAKVDGPDHPNPGNDTGARKFHWPSSASITIHRSGQVDSDAARQIDEPNAPANDTDGERKFHWPGSITIGIHREAQVDGPDQPNQGNDTEDGARKFHWPSSATLTIHRAGQVDSDAAIQIDGPNSPANDTDGERKFHWPGSVSFEIHREAKVDGPDHRTPGNDIEDGERRFHWPSSMDFTISRTAPALHHGNLEAPEGYKLDQEEKSYGFLPVLVLCNHTTQAGRTCADCTHSLLCFSNNLGVKRDCGPRYCDDGRCSSQPSTNCTATSNE